MKRSIRTRLIRFVGVSFALSVSVLGAPTPVFNSRAGQQLQWQLDFRVSLEQPGAKVPIEVQIAGEWISTVSASRSGERDVQLRIANLQIKSAMAQAKLEEAKQLGKRLGRPFWATYGEDGALCSIYFFKDTDPSDRNLLEMIATETQLIGPKPRPAQWTVRERDGAGEYLAMYNQSGVNAWTKHKLKYLHVDGSAGATPDGLSVAIAQSQTRFTFNVDGSLAQVDGTEQVSLGVSGSEAGLLKIRTETHLSKLRILNAPEAAGSLERARAELAEFGIRTQMSDAERARSQADNRLLDGHTTQSLLEAALGKTNDDPLIGERLAALFRTRAEATDSAVSVLRKQGANRRLTDALGNAASPAAIRGLSVIAQDRTLKSPLRLDALNAFVLDRQPSVEAMRVPLALIDDPDGEVGFAALLASGAVSRAGRGAHSEEADAIDSALIERYKRTTDDQQRAKLLAAFGNSLGPTILPLVETALRDRNDHARSAAARALRLASGTEVDTLLAAAITSDPDGSVRAAAISGANFHHPLGPELGAALVQVAASDPLEYVRSNAISLLRGNPHAAPHISSTLAFIAEHDTKPGIRRLAQEALASVSQTSPR